MKPWEEEWTAHASYVQYGGYSRAHFQTPERAKLAAAAPAMARALLAVEWSGEDGLRCPFCNGHQPPKQKWMDYEPGHADDCALALALRAAGVLDQPSADDEGKPR